MANSTDLTPGRREYYPLRAVDLFAIATFWLLLMLISTLGRELDPRIPGIPPRLMTAVVRVTYVEYAIWAVLTMPIWWLATRYSIEGGRRIGRVLLFVALGILIAILVDRALAEVRESLLSPGGRSRRRPPLPLFGAGFGFLDDLMVYFAVLGAGIARDYFLRYRARVEETIRLQAQLAQARLDVLRTQLNPHFLFNTLNAVSALVERDPRGVRRMIARLSDLLRYTLDEDNEQEVPLSRELDVLEEYIELMQIRFQGKLDVDISVEPEVRDALLPNLILQPIVENAMKHGVSRVTGAGRIALRARRDDGRLLITVWDNGPGPAGGSEGVGLRNTNARLQTMYGDVYGVELRPGSSGGTEAEIALPYHTNRITAGKSADAG
jgi:signal transduction histidine kinase